MVSALALECAVAHGCAPCPSVRGCCLLRLVPYCAWLLPLRPVPLYTRLADCGGSRPGVRGCSSLRLMPSCARVLTAAARAFGVAFGYWLLRSVPLRMRLANHGVSSPGVRGCSSLRLEPPRARPLMIAARVFRRAAAQGCASRPCSDNMDLSEPLRSSFLGNCGSSCLHGRGCPRLRLWPWSARLLMATAHALACAVAVCCVSCLTALGC